ncbi:MAG TPA: TRAP transporter small permease [Gammaproteobacteria bacterium]|nr:TRAP transporter small permease [Gammaproteobacteria bacterium]
MTLRALDRVEDFLTAALLAAMTLLTFLQVVLRYAFNSGLVWVLEATVYLFGWLVLVGISNGVRTGSHLAVDVITKHLSPRAQKATALTAIALSLLYVALMLIGSFTLVRRLYAFGNLAHDIPLPRWILLSSLPIGFALLGLRLVQAAMGIARGTAPPAAHGGRDEPARPAAAERGE